MEPDLRGSLQFYSESAGGRKIATPSDYLGCIFEYEGENFECRLLLKDVGPIAPGGRATVPIKFLRPELVKQRLHVGNRFRLREARTIGEGTVESIVNDPRGSNAGDSPMDQCLGQLAYGDRLERVLRMRARAAEFRGEWQQPAHQHWVHLRPGRRHDE